MSACNVLVKRLRLTDELGSHSDWQLFVDLLRQERHEYSENLLLMAGEDGRLMCVEHGSISAAPKVVAKMVQRLLDTLVEMGVRQTTPRKRGQPRNAIRKAMLHILRRNHHLVKN